MSVNEALKEIVKEQLEQYDISDLVRESAVRIIRHEYSNSVKELVKAKVQELVNEEIEILLKSPIEINDGYKPAQKYIHFEHLFKEQLREVLKSSDYRIKNDIMIMAKREVERLYDAHVHELKKAFVEKVTQSLNLEQNKP